MPEATGRMLRQPRAAITGFDPETGKFTINIDDADPRNSEFWAVVTFTQAELDKVKAEAGE